MQRHQDDARPPRRSQKQRTHRKVKQDALAYSHHPSFERQEIQRYPSSQSSSQPPSLLLRTKPVAIIAKKRNPSAHQVESLRHQRQQLKTNPLQLLQQIQRQDRQAGLH